MLRKIILLPFLFALLFFFNSKITIAQNLDCQNLSCSDSSSCQQKIQCLNNKINDLQGQTQTLSSQIAVMDAQINLTQTRIDATKQQISDLSSDIDTATKKITGLQSSLDSLVKVLLNRMVATYEVGQIQPFGILLSSSDVNNFFSRLNYLKLVQFHDKQLIYLTQQAKNDYSNQKNIFQDKKNRVVALKAQLESYTQQLEQNKADKQQLLTETQGSEAVYQQLLSQAQAELAGFTSFVNAAGATLANFGTGSNGWYYTQRDPQWGNMILPGSSSSVLLAGCAVTSVAMVCKSYGQGITPATMVSDPNKFISGDLWNWAFACDGKTSDWISSPSQAQVQNYVQNGTPVILRLIAPSVSGLHFVVAWKWNGSDFIIHDPYYGPDKNFSERYNWSQVTTAIAIH